MPSEPSLIDQFADAYRKVSGHVHIVADNQAAADIIVRILDESETQCAAMTQLPDELQRIVEQKCADREISLLKPPFDSAGLPQGLDKPGVGIGGARFGIAQSGTLVEVTQDDADRLVSALPRTYIGVVDGREIVPTLMDAAPRMRQLFEENQPNVAISFISGPSRTGDIEMILTLGVHGPETAHAIIIAGAENA